MKKSVFYLGLMILLMILVIPLNGYTAEKVTKVIGGVTMSNETLFPYHLALKNGYFEKEGLTVELKTFINGPSVMMSMANGELDICVGTRISTYVTGGSSGC